MVTVDSKALQTSQVEVSFDHALCWTTESQLSPISWTLAESRAEGIPTSQEHSISDIIENSPSRVIQCNSYEFLISLLTLDVKYQMNWASHTTALKFFHQWLTHWKFCGAYRCEVLPVVWRTTHCDCNNFSFDGRDEMCGNMISKSSRHIKKQVTMMHNRAPSKACALGCEKSIVQPYCDCLSKKLWKVKVPR